MLATVLARLKNWLIMAALFFVALAYAFFNGRREGRKDAVNNAVAESAKAAADANKEVQDARKETASMADGGAADQLRADWMRDKE